MPVKLTETPKADWTEGQFQAWLVALARTRGYRVHVTLKRLRKASIVADPDWPDLEMLRVDDRRHIFAELKAAGGRVSPGQAAVLDMLRHIHDAGPAEVYVWNPLDWQTIVEVLA